MFRTRSVKVILITFILFVSIALQNNLAMENSQTLIPRDQTNNDKIHGLEKYQNMNDQFDLNLQNYPDLSKNNDPSESHITNWEPRGINPNVVDPAAFVSYWNTSLTSSGSSSSNQIKLPLMSHGTYNFTVYWGDGLSNTITTYNDLAVTHSYSTSGVYNITITGTVIDWRFVNIGDRLKLMEIAQWGDLHLGNGGSYFTGCSNLHITANDPLDLTGTTSLVDAFYGDSSLSSTGNLNSWNVSQVTDMGEMFNGASSFNQPLNNWDVSKVTNMFGMFNGASSFNQPLDSWDVSQVTSMFGMFSGAISFNQPLDSWDVSKVTSIGPMFSSASSFNQPIGNWNVSKVTNMFGMFSGAISFNQPLDSWDVSQVTDMQYMFGEATFNQPLDSWDVSQVTDMQYMFGDASSFNQPLDSWDVSKVTNMYAMFYNASSFNQSLNSWNVSQVTNMWQMFASASSFNQPIGNWDVSQVTDMGAMFADASSFNQSLNSWNVSQVTDMYRMFVDASSFNQPIGNWNVSQVSSMSGMFDQVNLSIANYDDILTGWSARNLQHGIIFDAGYSQYSKTVGEPARTYIIDTFGWYILDGGVYPSPTSTSTTPTTTTSSTSTTPTSTTSTTTTSTTTTSSTSTTLNFTPFSWVSLIALPILGVMMQYKREIRKK